VELFKQVSIDWLGKKWHFFGFSWLLIALGIVGFIHNYRTTGEGLVLGIDFSGGTLVQLKFNQKPNLDLLRKTLRKEAETPPLIQSIGKPDQNNVQIRMQAFFGGSDVHSGRQEMLGLLRKSFDPEHVNSSQIDFNNTGFDSLFQYLLSGDPDNLKAQNKTSQEIDQYYRGLAKKMIDFRDKDRDGLVNSLDALKNVSGVTNAAVAGLEKGCFAGPVAVKGYESIGAIAGSDLRRRASWAVGLSFLGMLVN